MKDVNGLRQRQQVILEVEELQLAAGVGSQGEDAYPQLSRVGGGRPFPGCFYLSADEIPLICSMDSTGPCRQV